MKKLEVEAVESSVNQWGNGLALRLTKAVAKTAGTPVRIVAQPGRIIIERSKQEPALAELLATFDPKRHACEPMAFSSVESEVWQNTASCSHRFVSEHVDRIRAKKIIDLRLN